MDLFSTLQALVKPVATLAYAAFGIFLLAAAAGRRPRFKALSSIPAPFAVAYIAWLVLLAISLHSYFLVASVFLGVAIFAATNGAWRSRNLLLAGTGVMVLSVSMAWWLPTDSQTSGWWRLTAFALILGCVQAGFTQVSPQLRRSWRPALFLLYGLAGFAILGNMKMYEGAGKALKLLIHHQGAYIGPALHIKAGLIPFYDIPLQYGLGPSLSIAAACGASNCWAGMEWVMIATTLVMGFLLLSMALSTRVPRENWWLSAATLAIFIAVFLWPGFSFMGSIPATSPSTGGLRFLPVTLVAFLLFFGRANLAALALVPAVLWSPEVAAMSLVVFGVHETARLGFLKAAIRSAAIVAGSFLGLVLVHHAVYGVWVQPDVFAEYVLHVPGSLPIDPISNFLLLVFVMGLAAWNVWRQPADELSFRRDLVVTSLLFAATSYYLGRSHPNNVCNLMPLMVLVALRSLDGPAPAILPNLPRLAILGVSASAGAMMLSSWDYLPFQHGFSLDVSHLAAAASQVDEDMVQIRAGIANPDHLGIADLGHWNRNPAETIVWTGADPSCLFYPLPAARRQLYIKRSAARLRQPGWIILGEQQSGWEDDFRVAYRITEERSLRIQSAGSDQPHTYVVALLTPLAEVPQLTTSK